MDLKERRPREDVIYEVRRVDRRPYYGLGCFMFFIIFWFFWIGLRPVYYY